MKGVVVAVIAVVAVGLLTAEQGQGIDCAQLTTSLLPCLPYLTIGGSRPAPGCCAGVRGLKEMTATPEDQRAACECIKQAAGSYMHTIRQDATAQLPKLCDVDINLPFVNKDIDCSKIN